MFTGIVERTAVVHLADRDASGLRVGPRVPLGSLLGLHLYALLISLTTKCR